MFATVDFRFELCDTTPEADRNPATSAQPQTKGYPMIVGNFSRDAGRETYTGEITTLTFQRSNVIFRPTDKVGDRAPDYRIVQERDGAIVEFGAAWKRSSDKGRDFLSVMLGDPALPHSLYAALFLSDRDDRATLVWQRQTKKVTAAETEPANARPWRPGSGWNLAWRDLR
jgi:uncharacterized protein (DUF736 family)